MVYHLTFIFYSILFKITFKIQCLKFIIIFLFINQCEYKINYSLMLIFLNFNNFILILFLISILFNNFVFKIKDILFIKYHTLNYYILKLIIIIIRNMNKNPLLKLKLTTLL